MKADRARGRADRQSSSLSQEHDHRKHRKSRSVRVRGRVVSSSIIHPSLINNRSTSRSRQRRRRSRSEQHRHHSRSPSRGKSAKVDRAGGREDRHAGDATKLIRTKRPGGNPRNWTRTDVQAFLMAEGFGWNIINKFIEQNVCGANLVSMDESLLVKLGMDAMNIKHFKQAIREVQG